MLLRLAVHGRHLGILLAFVATVEPIRALPPDPVHREGR
jgi:hypothetical protein